MQTFPLSGGGAMPAVGLGFWKIPNDQTAAIVSAAVDAGYRHFDCACDYGNEAEAGEGLAATLTAGTVTRDDLFVTSKLWNTYHHPDHVAEACERSLSDLRLEYLDNYLIHFPIAQRYVPPSVRYPPEWTYDPDAATPRIELDAVPMSDTWGAMIDLQRRGLVRHIGVCNVGATTIRELTNATGRTPDVLQVELHPELTQEKLLRFCRESSIAVTAFSPLGAPSYVPIRMAEASDSLLETSEIRAIADAHSKTPAQVLLRWGIQRGTAVIPKTQRVERLRENIDVFDFELTDAEMATISGFDRGRRYNDPGDFAEKAFGTFLPIYE